MMMQPSSANVERAFSILTRILRGKRAIKRDYLEGSIMLIYNKLKDYDIVTADDIDSMDDELFEDIMSEVGEDMM